MHTGATLVTTAQAADDLLESLLSFIFGQKIESSPKIVLKDPSPSLPPFSRKKVQFCLGRRQDLLLLPPGDPPEARIC